MDRRARRNQQRGPSSTTIRDIAESSGVSVATVSRVLNGRPDVSTDTREMVLRHIRERGYASNRNARALAQGRTGLIGLTVPIVHAEYFNQIVSGAAEALYERDGRFVLCPTQHEHAREVSLLERVMHGTTGGAILILPSESGAELLQLRERGYPFVVVDPREPVHDSIATVGVAQWSGARMAVEHLVGLGHRRIGAITGPPSWVATIDRLAGYLSGLLAAGLSAGMELVREGDFMFDSGYRAAHELLALADPPTAIFAFNDNMAVGVLRAARERGLEIPSDLSVVGMDDVQIAEFSTPALTTVRQPLQEMGRIAVSRLYRLIHGQRLEAARIELSTRLVIRGSTGPSRTS